MKLYEVEIWLKGERDTFAAVFNGYEAASHFVDLLQGYWAVVAIQLTGPFGLYDKDSVHKCVEKVVDIIQDGE